MSRETFPVFLFNLGANVESRVFPSRAEPKLLDLFPLTDHSQNTLHLFPSGQPQNTNLFSPSDQSQKILNLLPFSDQSQNTLNLFPFSDQSQNILNLFPFSDHSQNILNLFPLMNQSQSIPADTLNLFPENPVRDLSQNTHNLFPAHQESQHVLGQFLVPEGYAPEAWISTQAVRSVITVQPSCDPAASPAGAQVVLVPEGNLPSPEEGAGNKELERVGPFINGINPQQGSENGEGIPITAGDLMNLQQGGENPREEDGLVNPQQGGDNEGATIPRTHRRQSTRRRNSEPSVEPPVPRATRRTRAGNTAPPVPRASRRTPANYGTRAPRVPRTSRRTPANSGVVAPPVPRATRRTRPNNGNRVPPVPRTNRRGPRQRSSVFYGVTHYKRTGRWETHVWDDRKQIYVGASATEIQAARANDRAMIHFKGVDTLRLNFSLDDYAGELQQLKDISSDDLVAALRRQSKGAGMAMPDYRPNVGIKRAKRRRRDGNA